MKLFAPVIAAATAASAALVFEDSSKVNAVTKVIRLLGEMQAQLETDGKKDEETFSKLDCWCKTNKREKEAAVEKFKAEIDAATETIETNKGIQAAAKVNIKDNEKDLKALTEEMRDNEVKREKELKAFNEENAHLTKVINNLGNAVTVLSRHNSFAQLPSTIVTSIKAVLNNAANVHAALTGSEIALPAQKSVAFLQSTEGVKSGAVFLQAMNSDFHSSMPVASASKLLAAFAEEKSALGTFLAQPAEMGKYTSQSGGIFGILKQMKDEMEANLKQSRDEDKENQDAYLALRAENQKQFDETTKQLASNKSKLASSSSKLAKAKFDLKEKTGVMYADIEFLADLKIKCQDTEHQFAQRQTERADESAAVTEALSILNSDENKTMFNSSVNFIQVSNENKLNQQKAAHFLFEASKKAPGWDDLSFQWAGSVKKVDNSPKKNLAALAIKAQMDSFDKVIKVITDMQDQLKADHATDEKAKKQCTADLNQNGKDTQTTTFQKKDTKAAIAALESLIEQTNNSISEGTESIAENDKSIMQASQTREEENWNYQQLVTEQRATQAVLSKVIERLNEYYNNTTRSSKDVVFAQKENAAPPTSFDKYKQNAGGNTVITMISKINDDSVKRETDAMKDEAQAQADYENLVGATNKSTADLKAQRAADTKALNQAQSDLNDENDNLATTNHQLKSLAETNANLHKECDFILQHFDARQKARQNEIDAITEAKAILRGQGRIGLSKLQK